MGKNHEIYLNHIEQTLMYWHRISLVIQFCKRILSNKQNIVYRAKDQPQANYMLFCRLFLAYAFGAICLDNKKNSEYLDFKILNLIHPVKHLSRLGSDSFAVRCVLSKRIIHCLKLWHVKESFDRLCKYMSSASPSLKTLITKKQNLTSIDLYYQIPKLLQKHPIINDKLFDIWTENSTDLRMLLSCISYESLKKLVAHRTTKQLGLFFNYIYYVFLNFKYCMIRFTPRLSGIPVIYYGNLKNHVKGLNIADPWHGLNLLI